ncbi:hypothetical protein ABZ297_36625 [Nonomuraea sp. NPDC005983]|uniref:hypothetical protein n=1 Tax=Nonomuraea sp. NPDC005983 TaxID=3155595 RepID=UPI0033BDE3C7
MSTYLIYGPRKARQGDHLLALYEVAGPIDRRAFAERRKCRRIPRQTVGYLQEPLHGDLVVGQQTLPTSMHADWTVNTVFVLVLEEASDATRRQRLRRDRAAPSRARRGLSAADGRWTR